MAVGSLVPTSPRAVTSSLPLCRFSSWHGAELSVGISSVLVDDDSAGDVGARESRLMKGHHLEA